MKCRFPETRLALFIEGDLSARQARATARHVRTCRECQGTALELRAGLDALKALAQPICNGGDFDDLQQRVAEGLQAIAASPHRALRVERAVFGGFHGRQALAGAATVAAIALWILATPQNSLIEAPHTPVAVTSVVTAMDRTTMTMPDAPDMTPAIVMADRPTVPTPEPHAIATHETADSPRPALPPDEPAAEPPQPLLVKLFTDDPNVVIYWLVEPQGAPDALSSF